MKSCSALIRRIRPLLVSLAAWAAHQAAPSRTWLTRDMRRRLNAAIGCCNNKETGTISQAAVKAAKVRFLTGAGNFKSNTPNALQLLLKLKGPIPHHSPLEQRTVCRSLFTCQCRPRRRPAEIPTSNNSSGDNPISSNSDNTPLKPGVAVTDPWGPNITAIGPNLLDVTDPGTGKHFEFPISKTVTENGQSQTGKIDPKRITYRAPWPGGFSASAIYVDNLNHPLFIVTGKLVIPSKAQ